MPRRLASVTAATVAAFVATTFLGPAGAGAAVDTSDPVVKRVNVRPETVGLYKGRTSRITVVARIVDDVGVTEAFVGLVSSRDESATQEFELERLSGTPRDGLWGATLHSDNATPTGPWAGVVVATDAAGNESALDATTPADEFMVKRNTMILDFNVREPATKGSFLRMTGRLVRLDPARGYVGYRNKTMHVLFKAADSRTWVKVGEVRTSTTGSFTNTRRFRARKDGTWVVVFDGTSNYLGEVSHRDYVDVR